MITKSKHPSEEYFVYAILELARNVLADLKMFIDSENNLISWRFLSALHTIQETEGLRHIFT